MTGAPMFRQPDLTGVIHFRASYGEEAKALIDHMVQQYNAQSFALLYQNDAYGEGPLKGAREQLKNHDIHDWSEIPYTQGGTDFIEQAKKIKNAEPQVIAFFSTAAATQETRRFLNASGLSMIIGSVVPNPYVSELPIVREYRATMDALHEYYSTFSLEGYIGTQLLVDAMEHISLPITRDKIRETISSYDGYIYKGLRLTFDPQTRSISPGVWIETNKTTQWEKQ